MMFEQPTVFTLFAATEKIDDFQWVMQNIIVMFAGYRTDWLFTSQ